ncbi:MAG: hypothetical protein ABJB86_07710 [Bacteroidota bacterium]
MDHQLSIDTIVTTTGESMKKKLEVTSTIRSPYSQASAMYPHFETNSTTLNKYAAYKKPWLEEIRIVYKEGKDKHETKEIIIKRMTKVIAAQVKQNKLISNHLTNSARDIRTREFSTAEIENLLSILKERNDIVIVDETKTSQPHIHIHLK